MFKKQKSMQQCKVILTGRPDHPIHLEKRKGKWQQVIDYCTKAETREQGPWELGERPAQGQRTDLEVIKRKLDECVPMTTIATEHFGQWCRYRKSFAEYKRIKIRPRQHDDPLYVVCIEGAPGLGKSYMAAHQLVPIFEALGFRGLYRKPAQTKWFDRYEGEEIIIMDDINGSWFKQQTLLQILDRYPTMVEPKGDTYMHWNPRAIIMTTNTPPEDWYVTGPTAALLRRITHRIRFDLPRTPVYTKGDMLVAPAPPSDGSGPSAAVAVPDELPERDYMQEAANLLDEASDEDSEDYDDDSREAPGAGCKCEADMVCVCGAADRLDPPSTIAPLGLHHVPNTNVRPWELGASRAPTIAFCEEELEWLAGQPFGMPPPQ